MTEKEKILKAMYEQSMSVYTWEEVKKLINAYEAKYNLSPCDGLPYNIKSMRVITGVQIVDLDKLK